MLRSLHIKLVLIMILLVVCLMAIAGAFLINSVNRFYLNEFYTQMVEVFSEDTEFVRDLVTAREGEQDGGEAIDQILLAKMGPLGVDGKNRNYYILDGETAEILASSDDDGAQTLEKLTPNLLIALNEKREGNESDLTANYMDLALPIQRGGQDYIIYILDQRATVRELNSQLFQLIIEALAFGLIISVLLSFLLSRAMVTPIRALTRGAQRVAEGDFDHKIQVESHDEIGVLTNAFNAMAGQLQSTLQAVDSERTKLSTLFLHMTDGVVAFNQSGEVIHANPAAEEMLDMEIPLGGTVTYQDLFGEIAPLEIASWSHPKGGYFVSFDAMPGTAKRTLALCKEAGVAMTAAGATFPYGIDPNDSNIRIAPSFPPVEDVEKAIAVFCTCVKMSALEKLGV